MNSFINSCKILRMNELETQIKEQEEEISLLDLFAVLWNRKKLIIVTTLIGMIFILVFSILSLVIPPEKSFLPNKYTPKAQMLINDGDSSSGGLSSMLSSSGLGSLASMAGVNVGSGGATNSALAGYLVHSYTIMDSVIEKFNLIERYKIKKYPKTESRKALKKVLLTNFDEDTGVFTVSFEDIDPAFACDVINYTVDLLEKRFIELGVDKNQLSKTNLEENIQTSYNNIINLQKQIQELELSVSNPYARTDASNVAMDTTMLKMELEVQEKLYAGLKAQYESLKISMASEQPVFQILEYAEVPDKKSGPSRGKLCIIVAFAAFFLSVFLAFLLNAIENIKKDPQAMAKLKGR